jgi:pyrimidine-specific ribonucleoside hydrolase
MIGFSFKTTRYLALAIALSITLLVTGCGSQSLTPDQSLIQNQTPKPVIMDVDMGLDDMLAILYLTSHPNVDIRAITVVGTGLAHCDSGVSNALGLMELSDQKDVPVTCGRETPLEGNHVFPADWRKSADDAYGVEISHTGRPAPLSAPELIVNILQSANNRISIVAVGPLTNIAEALQTTPEIDSKIEAIYIMGGAVKTDGNVGNSGVGIQNQYAEWNMYIDPVAANIVFNSGIPIILIPLDATKDLPVTRNFYKALDKNRSTPSANMAYELLTANLDSIDSGGLQFWDPLAATVFTDQSVISLEEMQLVVVTDEGPESGRTKLDSNGVSIKVAMSADRNKFEPIFLTVLNWKN